MAPDWRTDLREQRTAKDDYFGSNPHSPIPEAERDEFDGLSYYPIDEAYRYELEIHEHDDPDEVVVGTSTGGEQTYLEWGEFRFTVDGEHATLQAYKGESDQERLWVPFRDATSGEETYGAGRYLDLEPDDHLLDDGRWLLDFNQAYNPTCAYSDHYECPLPPTENWLEVPIEAGEQSFH